MFSEVLLRLVVELGPGATWLLVFLMFTITVFVVYIGRYGRRVGAADRSAPQGGAGVLRAVRRVSDPWPLAP